MSSVHFVNVVQYLTFVLFPGLMKPVESEKTMTQRMSQEPVPGEPGSVSVPSTSKAGIESDDLFHSESDNDSDNDSDNESYNDNSDRDSDFCIIKESKRKDISSEEDEILEKLRRPRKRRKLEMKSPVDDSPSTGTYICYNTHGN